MTAQVIVPMRFYHGHYFGRPSCPRCGELMLALEYPEYSECLDGDEIQHFWACARCDNRFNTLVKFKPAVA